MSSFWSRRQFINVSAQTAVLAAGTRFLVLDGSAEESTSRYQALFAPLDQFVEQYMREQGAPGMTLVLADRDGVQRVVTYGFSDVDRKISVTPDQLFQIGSISKSFAAHCALQLHEEGKLDFHKPVLEYLPWFRMETKFAPITTHHLLTHTTGLPGDPPVFLSDPNAKHQTAYPPGNQFHYNNMCFVLLGHLLVTLDGRPLSEIFRKRVFEPLGMTKSEPVITLDVRARTARSYNAFQNDRPYPMCGRLAEAPYVVITDASGCIASTPEDMGRYIQMIASHGKGPKGALLNEQSFALFSHPHIKAEEFGPTASYGYGIAVDTLEGHRVLRHTGGMVSFASALQVDIDAGVGAFASINAMQGYRPNPVAQYAIELMRAQRESKPHPAAPAPRDIYKVEHAAAYAGTFQGSKGGKLEFVAEGDKLFLVHEGKRVALEGSNDAFLVLHPDFDRFPLLFGRADAKDGKSPVVEASWGSEWFTNAKYSGPKTFDYPKEWDTFAGHYRNESPWIGSFHVLVRKGKLFIDGVIPLEPAAGDIYRLSDEESNTEWIRFTEIVNGHAMKIKFSGEDMWRVAAL